MAESSGPSDLRRSNILDLDGGLIQGLFLGPTCVNVTVTLPAVGPRPGDHHDIRQTRRCQSSSRMSLC